MKSSVPGMVRSDWTFPSVRDGVGDQVWSHRIAVLNAGATFLLILAGGLVTNTGSGLAVPDWPTTFGHNMLLFPWSEMVDGIFYEHSHRVLGAAVGLLTLALGAVLIQGFLGGLRVVLLQDSLAIIHGVLAQAFLALAVSLALFTSRAWTSRPERPLPADASHLGSLCLLITGLLYLQIFFGALLTHIGARLDAHLVTASLIFLLVPVLTARVLRRRVDLPELVHSVILLCGLLALQLFLGLGAYMARFTGVALPLGQFSVLVLPVAHRLNGGLLLVTSLVLTLWACRMLRWQRPRMRSALVSKQVPA